MAVRFEIEELVRLTGASVLRWPHSGPVRLTHDFNVCAPGDLFFPMHKYSVTESFFDALVRFQVSGVVIFNYQVTPPLDRYPDLGVLAMSLPPREFLRLGEEARQRSAGFVVGVTGSSGKSSTKEYLASILATRHRVHTTWRSRNLVHDCARVLLHMDGTPDEAAVIEMAFGAMGDVDRMAAMARPRAGIITKVTPEHLDGADGSWETVVREKGKLGDHLPEDGLLVLHAEDPGCARLSRSDYRCRVLTFGEGNRADLQYGGVRADETGTAVTLRFFGAELPCRLQACGAFQAANAAAAALLAHGLGFSPAEIRTGLERTPAPSRRFTVHRLSRGLTLVDDTFSANADNVRLGLAEAARLAGGRRLVAVISGVAALGDASDRYHEQMGAEAVAQGFTELFLIESGGVGALEKGAREAGLAAQGIHRVEKPEEIAESVLSAVGPDTLIYCKGSMYLSLRPAVQSLLASLAAAGFTPLPPAGARS